MPLTDTALNFNRKKNFQAMVAAHSPDGEAAG
jgi:hypothetical protein